MSAFYDQASLVVVPSGYKAGKVYAQKPLTTDGQLSFTRSTSATRVGPDGLIEKVRTNLLLQSNTFSTTWSLVTATVTSGQTDKEGGTNAWLLSKSASNGRVEQTISASGSLTFSVYAKANANSWILLRADTTGGVRTSYFNLASGVVGTSSSCTPSIESAGNGYYRCSISFNDSVTVFRIYVGDTNGSSLGTSGSIYIQDAQLETGDIATDYISTTSAAVSVGPVANVPRLDYLNSSCPRLLLEPQRTNSVLYSEQIDNAGWAKTNSPTITTNIATAPDGYGGADGIQDTTGGTFKRIRQNFTVTANQTHTASVFVKKETSETNYGGLALVFSNRWAYGIIDAVNGTIVVSSDSIIASSSTKVEDYGTYWRFSLTVTDNQSNTSLEIAYYATISTNGTSTGVGAGSVRTVWGFQLELGASYSSSYVPTLGAAVTRGADDAIKTGISSLIGQTEGVLFAEFNVGTLSSDVRIVATMSSGSTTNFVSAINDGTDFIARIRANTGALIDVTKSSLTAGTHKMAIAYSASDLTFYLDGVLVGQNTSASVAFSAALSELTVGKNIGAAALQLSGGVAQALIFKTRLTNAQLAELTTI